MDADQAIFDETHEDCAANGGRRSWVRRVWPACIFLTGAATVVLFGASGSGGASDGIPTLLVGSNDTLVAQTQVLAAPEVRAADTLVVDETGELPGDIVLMEVTAYCPCVKCCGPRAKGVTASGLPVSYNDGLFVAGDTEFFPFGTRLVVPGYGSDGGEVVEVIDRGGAIKGMKLDVYYDSHAEAKKWGRQFLPVRVLPPVIE
ncbi:MAG: 3D domain-containing protein [Planctomycetota bacterium]